MIKEYNIQTIAVKLNKAGQRSVKQGHPWIFESSILKINKEGKPGDVCVIFDNHTDKVIGVGLFDPDSPIRIKLMHTAPAKLNEDFFRRKIEEAFQLRKKLLNVHTNSARIIFGENDYMPGFIADKYAKVLVIKLYSGIWLPYLDLIKSILIEILEIETVVIRLSRQLQKKAHELKDGDVIFGELNDSKVLFREHGINFSADVIHGHKTGYFLDHRHNRRELGLKAQGKIILDVFAYAGGFSVHALVGGAKEVISVDISEKALGVAKENAALNEFEGNHACIAGDAFKVLKSLSEEGKRFDIVVIDPPSFAKSEKEIGAAKKKYSELAKLGAKLTSKNGLLVLASCSSRIHAELFFEINANSFDEEGVNFELERKTFHDIDHPISFKEGAYLKCGFYRIK